MYAVIETGGKQYRVELGAELQIDQLAAAPGDTIELGRVLLVADGENAHVGRPTVDGARVTGEVLRSARGDKVVVFKYRPKARHRVKQGHRQDLTVVRVADIEFDGRSAAREAQERAEREAKARAEAAQAAEAKAAADRALADRLAREQAAETKKQAAAGKTRAAEKGKSSDAGKAKAAKAARSKSEAAVAAPSAAAKSARAGTKRATTDEASAAKASEARAKPATIDEAAEETTAGPRSDTKKDE